VSYILFGRPLRGRVDPSPRLFPVDRETGARDRTVRR